MTAFIQSLQSGGSISGGGPTGLLMPLEDAAKEIMKCF
jgi:hypothetical protein